VWPDNKNLQDYRKLTLRHSVAFSPSGFTFMLRSHKADRFFEGNRVLLQKTSSADDPLSCFTAYLARRDSLFPLKPELWLRSDSSVPTRRWFLSRLRSFFPSDVAGHSLRSGGATALAEAGVAPNVIQAMGRWASNTFQIYIRTHPTLLAALLFPQH
jgi:hypothetical protein